MALCGLNIDAYSVKIGQRWNLTPFILECIETFALGYGEGLFLRLTPDNIDELIATAQSKLLPARNHISLLCDNTGTTVDF